MLGLDLAESGRLPDSVLRFGIRRILAERRRSLRVDDVALELARRQSVYREVRNGPIALATGTANEQHYEVPAAFYAEVLGARRKYSCGLWTPSARDLDASEEAMLALTCERAGIEDGQDILDLGCGWGSLTLWLAEHYPNARILAVSNSKSQREFILGACERAGFGHVEVETADVNHFDPERRFDRVVSVEMFEHVRNHPLLLSRIARWLRPEGRLFVHHFSHRSMPYPYEDEGDSDWMARHFFTGGIMPSDDMLVHCQDDLLLEAHWRVSGQHYQKTSDAWLARQDARKEALLPILAETYGTENAELWFQRWRLFFLACSELFGANGGNEWFVTHVRMAPRKGWR